MKKQPLTKGQPGYIAWKKKHELLFTLFLLAIAAGIFVLGLILNKWEKGNIFTIIAALFIIPMARYLTQVVLLFPFRSVSEDDQREVEQAAREGSIIYSDNVMVLGEKAMQLSFLVITSDKLLCCIGREKEDPSKIQGYLNDLMVRRGHDWRATVVADRQKFLSLLRKSDSAAQKQFASDVERECFERERQEVCKDLESLMV